MVSSPVWRGREAISRGSRALGTELNSKRLEILKDAVPKLARVGLLRPSIRPDLQLKEIRPAALALKLKLEEIDTQPDAKGLESAFQTAKQKQVGAIMTTTTRPFFAERKRIVELAVKYRLPAIYFQREFVDEGGLMSYGADYDDLFRRAAVYVDKILKGAKPADLPVQQATKFEFVINLKAAKQIGLTLLTGVSLAGESGHEIAKSMEQRAGEQKNRKRLMKRNVNGLTLCTMLFALSYSASAQQPKKVHRIGYLSSVDAARDFARYEGIRLALRDLGYTDGQNIAIEYRSAEGKVDRFPELAAELVRLKVDIIVVAGGYRLIRAGMNATKTIPIVMTGGGIDPVEEGLVESLARPGGNVTGLTLLSGELGGKRLELLKEAVSKVVRIAVLHDSATGPPREVKENLPVAARALGLTVRPWDLRGADDFEKAFAALSKDRPDGLYVLTAGPLIRTNLNRIVGFAIKSRVPTMFANKQAVEAGGLMSYGADLADSYRRVAYFVDRIFKGAKPADLPVEQPTKFELVINLKTAKQIGVTIPPDLLARATKIIR